MAGVGYSGNILANWKAEKSSDTGRFLSGGNKQGDEDLANSYRFHWPPVDAVHPDNFG
jgi:hypothetical protein